MKSVNYSRQELSSLLSLLDSCYGLNMMALPESIQIWLKNGSSQNDAISLSLCTDTDELDTSLGRLEIPLNKKELRKALLLLTYIMRNSDQVRNLVADTLFNGLLEKEQDKFIEFLRTLSPKERITIRGESNTVRIENYSDWLRTNLLPSCLEWRSKLSSQRKTSLGNEIKDPRIPMIISGTRKLLLNMKSEIDDDFCDVLLALLKLQGIVPVFCAKDRDWVRLECRLLEEQESQQTPIGSF